MDRRDRPLGFWEATDKIGNPTPYNSVGTSTRVSVEENGIAATLPPNYPSYLYQVVSADKTKRSLKFDLYWIAHTIKPAEFTVYGSTNPNDPWTYVWKPFAKTILTALVSPAGSGSHNAWLWNYYSNTTFLVSTTIPQGFPYYRIETHFFYQTCSVGLR